MEENLFNLMKNTGFILTQDSLYIIFILFLLALILILFPVNLTIRKSLSKEQIILSFKQ